MVDKENIAPVGVGAIPNRVNMLDKNKIPPYSGTRSSSRRMALQPSKKLTNQTPLKATDEKSGGVRKRRLQSLLSLRKLGGAARRVPPSSDVTEESEEEDEEDTMGSVVNNHVAHNESTKKRAKTPDLDTSNLQESSLIGEAKKKSSQGTNLADQINHNSSGTRNRNQVHTDEEFSKSTETTTNSEISNTSNGTKPLAVDVTANQNQFDQHNAIGGKMSMSPASKTSSINISSDISMTVDSLNETQEPTSQVPDKRDLTVINESPPSVSSTPAPAPTPTPSRANGIPSSSAVFATPQSIPRNFNHLSQTKSQSSSKSSMLNKTTNSVLRHQFANKGGNALTRTYKNLVSPSLKSIYGTDEDPQSTPSVAGAASAISSVTTSTPSSVSKGGAFPSRISLSQKLAAPVSASSSLTTPIRTPTSGINSILTKLSLNSSSKNTNTDTNIPSYVTPHSKSQSQVQSSQKQQQFIHTPRSQHNTALQATKQATTGAPTTPAMINKSQTSSTSHIMNNTIKNSSGSMPPPQATTPSIDKNAMNMNMERRNSQESIDMKRRNSQESMAESKAVIAKTNNNHQSKAVATTKSEGKSETVIKATPTSQTSNQTTTTKPQAAKTNAKESGGKEVFMVKGRPYFLLEIIGSGGSSKVFKVLSKDKQIYALKRIKIGVQNRGHVANYRNEIALLQKMKGQRNVIQLVDVEELNNYIYMVFEYGQIDLSQFMKQQKDTLDENAVRYYWQQILQCVKMCHVHKVIHLDLKPPNFVFVDGFLKIIDFGIAKEYGASANNDTTSIVRESQIGTINYMSPESIMESNGMAGKYKLGRSSDIWSLGCILYQMVHGKTPFSHLKLIQKLHSITDKNCQINFPPTGDVQLDDCLRMCLERNPTQRPTIDDLLKHPYLHPSKCSKPENEANAAACGGINLAQLQKILEQVGVNPMNAEHIAKVANQQIKDGKDIEVSKYKF